MTPDPFHIAKYVGNFLNTVLKDTSNNRRIGIKVEHNNYTITINSKKLICPIYPFWNKTKEQLIDEFTQIPAISKKHNVKAFQNPEQSNRGYDYIGTIFFHLSGYWEYTNSDNPEFKDEYGRFRGKSSFGYLTDTLEIPVVDLLVKSIKAELKLNYSEEYQKPKAYITHDIDKFGYTNKLVYLKFMSGDILKRKSPSHFFRNFFNLLTFKNPLGIEQLIKKHIKHNTKGTYFFLPGKMNGLFGKGYDLKKNAKYLKKVEKKIDISGGDIGLHYHPSYINQNRMIQDKEHLENLFDREITAGRSHYLIFDITRSFKIFEESGIKYDTTGSYADMSGFRFGTSYKFRPFNFEESREYRLFEIPLIIMDGTLFSENYQNLDPQAGYIKIQAVIDIIREVNGIFTFLWHNSSFYTENWNDREWVYINVLESLKKSSFIFQ